MNKLFLTVLFTFFSISMVQSKSLNYKISITQPQTHYADVIVKFSGFKNDKLEFKLPVWTPGSYLVREFEKNIENVVAIGNGKNLVVSKTDKNTWQINTKGLSDITVSYKAYCFEASVRTCYIDSDHAFILSTSLLMFIGGNENTPGSIEFQYPDDWKEITTTLEHANSKKTFIFQHYDELADSPIEIGNQKIIEFEVGGVPHKVALTGQNNCNVEQFKLDLQKVCNTMFSIIGEHPCKEYVFFVNNVETGGGGLEHMNSCAVQIPRWNWSNKEKYNSFLGLCAHEYFHLWNVKRIRPKELGPFNYSSENYTNLLWVAEGITSYFDEWAMLRAGFSSQEDYLKNLSTYINDLENRPGSKVQSLASSSRDAWIKEYRPNENSKNTSISYYSKGLLAAMLLNAKIVESTNGSKNIDDLMKYLWTEYYKNKKRGFTEDEFTKACNIIANTDLSNFISDAVYTTKSLPYKSYLDSIGLICEEITKEKTMLGITTSLENGKTMVKFTERDLPAYNSGINVNDEFISINNIRVNNNVDELIELNKSESVWNCLISRNGLLRTIQINNSKTARTEFKIKVAENIDATKNSLLNKWLSKI